MYIIHIIYLWSWRHFTCVCKQYRSVCITYTIYISMYHIHIWYKVNINVYIIYALFIFVYMIGEVNLLIILFIRPILSAYVTEQILSTVIYFSFIMTKFSSPLHFFFFFYHFKMQILISLWMMIVKILLPRRNQHCNDKK